MVTVDKAVIARLDKGGKHFEVLVDPELAYALKEGKSVSIQAMLAVNQVFSDASKGTKSSEDDMKLFKSDVFSAAEEIIKKGDVQLTAEFRRKKAEDKRRQIASIISKNAINPQTKLPHPQERIENAMEKARVNIDPFLSADQQIPAILAALRPILPISIEQAEIEVKISAKYASRVFGALKSLGEISGQTWGSDGSLVAKIKVPAGLKQTIYSKINALTEGSAIIK
ncbi:MAG: ribosome assembly factor SBDS [Candidatus Aenigmarchaeota archaeon]|nr:ribosome assembly factor SBDS [Candidatus Aenigmarchaeota archaeon]